MVDKYVKENIKLAIFNLGYLPNSNSKIITNKDDTLFATADGKVVFHERKGRKLASVEAKAN